MTTRRSFLTGLMASAALPAIAPALPKAVLFEHTAVGKTYAVEQLASSRMTAALAAAMRQTQEQLAANIFNTGYFFGRE